MLGDGPDKIVIVDVQVQPQISISPSITVVEGQSVILQCNITTANPATNVTWFYSTNTVIPSTNGSIIWPSVNRNQHGLYTCRVSNGIGSPVTKTTFLRVNYGPEFSQRSIEYQSCIGDNATIACNAIGRPPPDVSLYRNGSLLRMNTGILNHRLPFDSSSKFGSYICISNNTLGVVNITTTFKIKPSGKVENVQLSVKDDSIKVTWQLPQCKGNIGEIKVQYRKKGQSSWQWEVKTPTSSDKEITIKGLDKGSEYEVRVVVIDIKGTAHEMTGAKVARTEKSAAASEGILIGFTIGGIFFLIILIAVLVIYERNGHNSSSGKYSMGRANQGLDEDVTKSASMEMGNIDSIHYKT